MSDYPPQPPVGPEPFRPTPPSPPPPPPRRPPPPASTNWTAVLLAILLGLVIGWSIYRLFGEYQARQNAKPRVVTPRGSLSELEKTNIKIFENASPSVTFIVSELVQQRLFGLDILKIPAGAGSGFVWDQNGHVVTNFHVIEGAAKGNVDFEVTLADHSTYRGVVIGASPENDLAVLRIDAPASSLIPITIGSSSNLQVGQLTVAIGNPFGLDQTLTTGVVSALGRVISESGNRQIKNVIQTDAAINPGNSGGPLLDSAGRLIGVNTAIYSPTGTSTGIGFAIPVDTVNRVVPQLIAHGRIVRPQMGIVPAHDSIVRRMGLQGVLIVEVEPNSPAEKAGLMGTRKNAQGQLVLGDLITAIDGKPVKTVDGLLSILEGYKSGDTIKVTFVRNGQEKTAEVTLR